MALVSMRELLDHAAENGYGIPAFNVNNLEQVQAVMSAADEVGAPVILQASAGARKYAGEKFIKHLIEAAVETWPHIPLVMHQDHGASPAVCQGAIDLGFGSVMMDGSLMEDAKTPSSFEYNIEVTRKVVEMAHKVGVTVEGELGVLGSLETGEAGEEDGVGAEGKLEMSQMLTDPEEAAQFVKATQLDALAIAIGTSHGAYKFTRKVVEMAHKVGVTVEGELGVLGSLETGEAGEEDGVGAEGKLEMSQMLTDPEEAAQFVKATQLDALAIAIGTSHGAYKFTRKPTGDILAISRVKEIHARIPNTHLVMHGSSSVPQELLAIIRQYGGQMKETYGVPVEEIQQAIKYGVRKVNIDTDIRLAMTGAVRKFMHENPEKFDAREWLKPAREAAKALCKQRYLEFGCEGQGAKIKGIPLSDMAQKYAKGELNQMVK